MKKIFIAIVMLAFNCSPIYANSDGITKELRIGWESIKQSNLKTALHYLASRQLQGRLSLTEGNNQAIQWIADQFKQIGLQPIGDNNSYLQAVPVIEYFPDIKNTSVELKKDDKTIRWTLRDLSVHFFKDLSLHAPVVFAGYGITAPELQYDDYQNIDVRGKIVMVFEHEPQENDPNSIFNGIANTVYAATNVKVLNAQHHGAIAVIIAPEPNRKHPSNRERATRLSHANNPKTPFQVLMNDEVTIPSVIITDEVAGKIAGNLSLSQLQTEIDKNLKPQSRLIPSTQISINTKNLSHRIATTYNVVGLLEGSDPVLKNETIIVSAHHDHNGSDGERVWHGADDNASGTVGVVALAKALTANANADMGLKPKRSILFTVFAAEERGLLGAFHMTAHPLRPLATTKAMINFDMIGRNEAPSRQTEGLIDIPQDTSNRLNLIGSHYSPDYDQIVAEQNHLVGLDLDHRFDNEHVLNTFFRSDQFPFVLHRIPAFWWFTGFHPDYHHTTDTAEKINYVKMQKILRLSYLSTYAFANTNQEIRFIDSPGKSDR